MNANPPAGWYPDPHGQAELRYWDGNTWTEHTSGEAPGAAGPTQIDQPQAAPEAQYEAQQPFAAAGPGAAPGRTGGPPKGLLIGLGALALVGIVVGVLFLAGVLGGDDEGGGQDDEEQIRAVIDDTIENYDDPDICDNWTDDYHETVEGGKDNCLNEVDLNSQQDHEVKSVQVDGEEATAEVEIEGEETTLDLKKEDDKWLIDEEVPGVCCIGGFAGGGGDTTTDDGGGGGGTTGVEGEVRDGVNRFITAIQEQDAQEFCNVTSIKFKRDRGVTGSDDRVIEKCPDEARRIINDLIIASDPEIDTVTAPGGEDFQTVNVTLTDTSVLNVIGTPGEFWFVDTFR
jgi:hypothetical protein